MSRAILHPKSKLEREVEREIAWFWFHVNLIGYEGTMRALDLEQTPAMELESEGCDTGPCTAGLMPGELCEVCGMVTGQYEEGETYE